MIIKNKEGGKQMKSLRKIEYNSPVILTFTLISFLSLLLGYVTNFFSTQLVFMVYRGSLLDPLFYVRLFTHVLGHSNWEHYMGNFMIILLIGPMLEEKYGSKRLMIMILFTAFVTGLINVVFFNTALLGASGIAFMMILLSSIVNMRGRGIPLTLILVGIVYIGNEVMNGIFSNDNVSQITHIIGGLCGCMLGYYFNKK